MIWDRTIASLQETGIRSDQKGMESGESFPERLLSSIGRWSRILLANNLLHPPHGTALKPNLDTVWMSRRLGEDVLNNAISQFAGALVLFEYN